MLSSLSSCVFVEARGQCQLMSPVPSSQVSGWQLLISALVKTFEHVVCIDPHITQSLLATDTSSLTVSLMSSYPQ